MPGKPRYSKILHRSDGAFGLLEKAGATYAELGDALSLGRVAQIEAALRQEQGDHATATRKFAEAEEIFRQIGAEEQLALGQLGLGVRFLFLGRLKEAATLLDRAYTDFSRQGEAAYQAVALRNLGEIYFLRGNLRQARQAFASAPSAYATYWLARIDAEEGRSGRAVQALRALVAGEKRKDPAFAVQIDLALGDLLLAEGKHDEALSFARKAERELAGRERQDLTALSQILIAIDGRKVPGSAGRFWEPPPGSGARRKALGAAEQLAEGAGTRPRSLVAYFEEVLA